MDRQRLDPLALLRQIEQDAIAAAPALPQEIEAAVLWSGVGFKIGDRYLASRLDHVLEVLPAPALTPAPGVKSWVRGVANVRGDLITVVDLAGFLGHPTVFLSDRARLLVMNVPELRAGLLVSEVLGLRHFDEEVERREVGSLEDSAIQPYLDGAFVRDDVLWGVFDMKSLAASPAFKHVAA